MPHHHKKPVSSLGQSYFTSSGNPKYDLSDPVLKSAIASLPDKHRALAIENFKKKKITAGSHKILEELEHYKSPFSEEQRIKLLKHRLRDPHGAEINLATTLPNVAVLAPRVAKSSDLGDDNDPTRLAASVKTPTGTFDDVGCVAICSLWSRFADVLCSRGLGPCPLTGIPQCLFRLPVAAHSRATEDQHQ